MTRIVNIYILQRYYIGRQPSVTDCFPPERALSIGLPLTEFGRIRAGSYTTPLLGPDICKPMPNPNFDEQAAILPTKQINYTAD
jgi:hypothetical protein